MLDDFGKLVRSIRLTRSLLLYDMAKDLDISPAELSAIECGRKPLPDWFIAKLQEKSMVSETCALGRFTILHRNEVDDIWL